jgi:DeoR/GlpR family transcriptional regulator of sugar metabolism
MLHVTRHEKLIQAAKDAIDAVFSDTSVSQRQTLEDLGELADELEIKQECIRNDIKEDEEKDAG